MKRTIIYCILFVAIVFSTGLSSFLVAKNRADNVAIAFEGSLSPLKGQLVIFGDDPLFPCWVFRGEYSNVMTGATFDVYVSFFGKVLKKPGEDIRTGMENNAVPQHSRYYELTPEQVARLGYILAESDTWGYTHSCADWASDVGRRVTGENVDADDWFGFETPRELSRSLERLEGRRSTSPFNPLPPPRPKKSSWLIK